MTSGTLEEGEALQAAAYAERPIHPRGFAMATVVVVAVLLATSTIVMALRTYIRAWPGVRLENKRWGWEDSFFTLGYATYTCSSVFVLRAVYYGLGTRDAGLNEYQQVRCAEYTLYANVIYGFSIPLIKAGVVFTLLRIVPPFPLGRFYHFALYAMQFTATVMALVGILATLLYCHPVRAYWNPLLGSCSNFMTVVRVGYAWTATGIATDWTCAILPWFIIRRLQMPARTKGLIMMILSLGAIASTATIIECGLGLIAAALPALRFLIKQLLESSITTSSNAHSGNVTASGYGHSSRNDKPIAMATLPSNSKRLSSAQWKRIGDDGESTQGIVHTSEEQLGKR